MMNSDTTLDYALFHLSPTHSHCELLVSGDGQTEKLASGLLKPFVTHLKVAEEQVAQAASSIKLEVDEKQIGTAWFTKGTLERFVRFVSTPEVLELVNTFDAELTQLEGARRIYLQGTEDPFYGTFGRNESAMPSTADMTKKELLKAIDVRVLALKKDLTTSFERVSAAGFTLDNISELLQFAEWFGAYRLNEACTKFLSHCNRWPEIPSSHLPSPPSSLPQKKEWKEDRDLRISFNSDMSIDDDPDDNDSVNPTPSQPMSNPLKNIQLKKFVERENKADREQSEEESSLNLTQPLPPPAGGTRRLSVQDRINLFENKKKDQPAGDGIKIGGKGEFRRLSSDVSSSVEKNVLRRWSGASDMSIELNTGDSINSGRKEVESSSTTPSYSYINSQTHTASGNEEDPLSSRPQPGSEDRSSSSSSLPQQLSVHLSKEKNIPEGVGSRYQSALSTQLKSSSGRDFFNSEQLQSSSGQSGGKVAHEVGIFPDKKDQFDFSNSEVTVPSVGVVSGSSYIAQFRTSESKSEDPNPDEKFFLNSQSELKALPRNLEDAEIKSNQPFSKPSKSEDKVKGESDSSQVQSTDSLYKVQQEEYLGVTSLRRQEMKLHRQTSGPDQVKKSHGKRQMKKSQTSELQISTGRRAGRSGEALALASESSIEPVHITNLPKGNHELNDELQVKADELEKLFAAHKLRVPGDNPVPTQRGKASDMQMDNLPKVVEKREADAFPNHTPVRNDMADDMEVDGNRLMKMVDSQDCSSSTIQRLGDLNPLEDSKGKFYERYMQKRDTKLREEWGSKRAQKEARMKAMQDSLEHSRAEMKVKFAASSHRSDSALFPHRHTEKLRTYNDHVVTKNKEQLVDFQMNEEDDDPQQSFDQQDCGQDRIFNETPLSDSSSKSNHSKKPLARKNVSSSTPRSSGMPFPKPSTIPTNSVYRISGKHRMQPVNPLGQSVPNFSNLRKENTKSVSGIIKTSNHTQRRINTRSKSISEDIIFDKDDLPRRSESMRKSYAGSVVFKDLSTLNSDSGSLPMKSSKEKNGYHQTRTKIESKPFLRKGSGIGPGSGAGIVKVKKPVIPENLRNEGKSEELTSQMEISSSRVNEDNDGFQIITAGETFRIDNGNLLNTDSVNSGCQELENDHLSEPFSQVEDDSLAPLATPLSNFNKFVLTKQESPEESPMSWNSQVHHSFSYAQDTSDVHASMNSPVGSSWNSHPLNQMTESDTARMRKKWGNAQKPVFVSNTSHQSKKDVTKGFKRLLKFGRKSKGSDALINDWVSASTNSEGDDDTEDGRDQANRISDDMRKSRMGFPQFHSSFDSFNDGEIFPEQAPQSFGKSIPTAPANFKMREDNLSGSSLKAPRSFFSLSTFRGKGSESSKNRC